MGIPYFPPSPRRPHYRWLRAETFRDHLLARSWSMKGAYAEKCIGEHDVMVTSVREEKGLYLCKFQLKDNFWSDITGAARAREALECRAGFALVLPPRSQKKGVPAPRKRLGIPRPVHTRFKEARRMGERLIVAHFRDAPPDSPARTAEIYAHRGQYVVFRSGRVPAEYPDLQSAAAAHGIKLPARPDSYARTWLDPLRLARSEDRQ